MGKSTGRIAARLLTLVFAALVGPVRSARAEEPDLAAARSLLLKGRYEEAAERFSPHVKEHAQAAIGLARARASVGRYDEAQPALEAAVKRLPQSADLFAELAFSAFERGNYETAARHKAAAFALDKDQALARWVEAELLKYSGKLDEAQQAYAWFATDYNRAPRIDNPQTLVILGRGMAEHARWTRNSKQFRRLVSDVYPAALRLNSDYWPARLESALLYLEKYNEADAAAEFTAGLALNPQAAELHAARAALALDSFDLATAKTSLDRALEINPRLVWALQLRADWFFADVRPTEAIPILEAALKVNPRNEGTLGRLFATRRSVGRQGELSPQAQSILDQVQKSNPHCGEFYLAAAQSFERMRRYPLAAEFYQQAGQRMPQLLAPRGLLGLVLMRLGNEAEAEKLLSESLAIDPFNVRVKNQLEVLDVLKHYAVLETDHFVLKFDRGQDELLAKYAAQHLEETFANLTQRLGYTPKDKTLIEIFSRSGNESGQNWFSARMVGLPLIGPVGACAGKMVALSSPTQMQQKYDWARVLRHELVHVINLQQTDFCVPHWFTEGLAVHLEDEPRPRQWLELLARRARAGTLFALDDITLGFVRPKDGDDWTLAYCQSELYIEHLLQKYGDDAPRRMLTAYADHLTTPQALEKLFDVTTQQFEADYRERIDDLVAASGPSIGQPRLTLAQLQMQVADAPDDADAMAELARAWLDRDDKPQARRWALAARKVDAKHQLAAYVLARLELSIGDTEAATARLEQSLDRQQPQENLLALYAALKLKAGEIAAAQALYELGIARLPHSDRWVKGLVKIHLESGNSEKLMPMLQRLYELEPDNSTVRKKLAELSLAAKDYVRTAQLATSGIHADVEDASSHAMLAAALAGQEKHAAAILEYQVALQLNGDQPDWLAGLAHSLLTTGKRDEATEIIARLRKADADHPKLPSLEKAAQP